MVLYKWPYTCTYMQGFYVKKIGAGVTGQNIPPAGVYPGILWPRSILYPGVYFGLGQFIPPQAIVHPAGVQIGPGHNIPGYNLAWAALTPFIIRAGRNLSRLNAN